jgi:hypothetical protein
VTTRWREEFGPHFQFRGLLNVRPPIEFSARFGLMRIPETYVVHL